MDHITELIWSNAGPWAIPIVIGIAVGPWAITTVISWFSNRSGMVHGSPASASYWRARFAEALAQHDQEIDLDERQELAARVTEARIMVEAHEAKRRVGIGGVASGWILVAAFGLTAVLLNTAAGAYGGFALQWWAGGFTLAMVGAELTALLASSAGKERFNVLVAAGRYGRSDLVREDPWRVLREYDYARTRAWGNKRVNDRARQDRELTTARIRFERSIIGVSAYQDGLGISPSEVWPSLPVVPVLNASEPARSHQHRWCGKRKAK